MNERPTSVTVFAVINIILCALGVIGTIFWLLSKLPLLPEPSQKHIIMQAMEDSTAITMLNDATNTIGVIVIILSLAASIAMLGLKSWGRLVTIWLGVYGILVTTLSYALHFVLIFNPLRANTSGADLVMVRVNIVIGLVFSAIFVGYSLLMIYWLSRPHVVEAFTSDPLSNFDAEWDGLAEGDNL